MGYNSTKTEGESAVDAGLIPAGTYRAVIQSAELSTFSPKSKNADRDMIKLVFKLLDGEKAGSRMFVNLGNFTRWAPTTKNPDGSDNSTFFSFWAAVRGEGVRAFRRWYDETEDPFAELFLPSQLEGRTVRVEVKVVKDTWAYEREAGPGETEEDFKKSEISGFKWDNGESAVTTGPTIKAVEL